MSENTSTTQGPKPHHDDKTRFEKAKLICIAYAEGRHSLEDCCKFYKITDRTFRRWVDDDPEIEKLYTKAKFKYEDAEMDDLFGLAKTNMRRACEGFDYTIINRHENLDENGKITGAWIEKTTRKLPPNVQALKYIIDKVEKRRAAITAAETAKAEAEKAKAEAEKAVAEAELEKAKEKNRSGCMKTLVIMPAERELDAREKAMLSAEDIAEITDENGSIIEHKYRSVMNRKYNEKAAQERAKRESGQTFTIAGSDSRPNIIPAPSFYTIPSHHFICQENNEMSGVSGGPFKTPYFRFTPNNDSNHVSDFTVLDETSNHQTFPNFAQLKSTTESISLTRPESGQVQGEIKLPTSKSICNRALLIRALCGTFFNIYPLSDADDTRLMLQVLSAGEQEIYVRNAGTVMRFLTAYYAAMPGKEAILKGEERMNSRPIAPLVEVLNSLGAEITYLEKPGYPPISIQGKRLKGGEVSIQASQSSQFITALLLIAPTLEQGLQITLEGEIVSRPYIQLTLDMLTYFGIKYSQPEERIICIPAQAYNPLPLQVEADWSAASYFYALAALFPGSELQLPGLFPKSWQGDSILQEWMQPFGIKTTFNKEGATIKSTAKRPVIFRQDFIHNPDLVPTFVCLCCALGIPFHISGTHTLRHKESDRAQVLATELAKAGYHLNVSDNEIQSQEITPPPPQPPKYY